VDRAAAEPGNRSNGWFIQTLSQIRSKLYENTRRIRAGTLADRQNLFVIEVAAVSTTHSDVSMLSGFSDRRKSERVTVRTAAKILLPQSDTAIDCLAVNVSDGGAQLQVRATDLPDVFVLHFPASGKRRHCRVVWRKGSEVGVAFTDRAQVNFGRRITTP
jgi:hypothetical protein